MDKIILLYMTCYKVLKYRRQASIMLKGIDQIRQAEKFPPVYIAIRLRVRASEKAKK